MASFANRFHIKRALQNNFEAMLRFLALAWLLLIGTGGCLAGPTNVVRTAKPWYAGSASGRENWTELMEAAKLGFVNATNDLKSCEVIGWCIKIDSKDCPPRLFEEAVVLIKCSGKGLTNAWALAHVGRMPGGGARASLWSIFPYPRPIANFRNLPDRPSDQQIASFIHNTNFGYNDFYLDRVILDVVLFHESKVIEMELRSGLSETDKQARHAAYLKSIPY